MTSSGATDTSGGVRLRPAADVDVEEIAVMLDAATRAFVGRPTTPEEVRDRLATGGADPTRDSVVAVDPSGTVVGFGHLWPAQPDEIRCFGRTHPDHRGRGVGTAVQQWLVARAEEVAADLPGHPGTLTTTTWPRDTTAGGVLAASGYEPVRYFQKMVMDFSERRPTRPRDVPGVVVRTATANDHEAIFDAFVEAFAEHWGEESPDPEQWWRERRDAPTARFDRDLWLVATEGERLAGFVIGKVQDDPDGRPHGYIGDLGVRPQWRGRGVGELLLSHSLGSFRERGLPRAELDVDTENTTGAVRLYTKVGMKPRPSFTIWSRPLPRAST